MSLLNFLKSPNLIVYTKLITLFLFLLLITPINIHSQNINSVNQQIKLPLDDNETINNKSESIDFLNEENTNDDKDSKKENSLNELLINPFNQFKDTDNFNQNSSDLEEPTKPQQSLVEKNLERKVEIILSDIIPQEYVSITASVKYFTETVPVTKNNKKIAKIKLPGFENHVWVPTKSKDIVGIVNQTRTFTTIFIVVKKPISPFNIEVLRQTLTEKVEEINFLRDDVMKVVYVPHASSIQTSIQNSNKFSTSNRDNENLVKNLLDKDLIEEGVKENNTKKKKPEKLKEDIDMLMKMETTRYLLKARNAYERDDYYTAINAISEAIDVNPFSPQAFEMLGSIYYRLGWNNMALENWQRALKLEPSNELLRKYISRVERL